MDPILGLLAVFAGAYLIYWVWRLNRERAMRQYAPGPGQLAIGIGTNFFDTLGIGSFAPTASVYKLTRMVPDSLIPGTMNVGHTIPVVVMAYIYISIVEVEVTTLTVLIVTSILGAWLGAGFVSRLAARPIQIGIGIALLIAGVLMAMSQLELFPVGGEALGLSGGLLIAAAIGSFILGALNCIGVGLFAMCS